MKHRVLKLAVIPAVLALSMLPVAARADSNPSAEGGGSAASSGLATKHFAFSASLGSSGASGYAVVWQDSATFGNFRLQGPVSCLSVSGNEATIGIAIQKGDGTAASHVGEQFYLFVQDNSQSASGATPDGFDNSGYTGQPPSDVCPPAQPVTEPVTQGNITVNPGS